MLTNRHLEALSALCEVTVSPEQTECVDTVCGELLDRALRLLKGSRGGAHLPTLIRTAQNSTADKTPVDVPELSEANPRGSVDRAGWGLQALGVRRLLPDLADVIRHMRELTTVAAD